MKASDICNILNNIRDKAEKKIKAGEEQPDEIPVLDHIPEGFEIFELKGLHKKYLALKTACPFCTHCTDVFYDWNGPYMWVCDLDNNCGYGMSGNCKDFVKE